VLNKYKKMLGVKVLGHYYFDIIIFFIII